MSPQTKNSIGLLASMLAAIALFTFVGYKVGESHAPAIRFELLPC